MDRLRHPWLVACWPGMGSVSLLAGRHLVRALRAEPVGELPSEGWFDVHEVRIDAGVLQPVVRPRLSFHAFRDPTPAARDLLVLLADAQPNARGWDLCQALLERVREHGVRRVVTFASLASPVAPGAPSRVQAVATSRELLQGPTDATIPRLQDGTIGGLNGVLLAAAAERGLEGLCLLGSFPFVAPNVPNPTAAAAVLRAFEGIGGPGVDVAELEARGRDVDRRLAEALRALRERSGSEQDEERDVSEPGLPMDGASESPPPEAEEPSGPSPAEVQRIEHLFTEAARDRRRALALKAELDRLGVFARYEDRFLDLFKRGE